MLKSFKIDLRILPMVLLLVVRKEVLKLTVDAKKRLQFKMNHELADEANAIFEQLGLTPTVVITALYKRVVAEGRIPFEFGLTEDERAAISLARTIYNSDIPVLDDPDEIEQYLSEDDDDEF